MTPDERDEMRYKSAAALAEGLIAAAKFKDTPPMMAPVLLSAGTIMLNQLAEIAALKALLKAKQRKK